MNFKDEVYNHYVDSDGLVTIDRDPGKWTTGNGLLYLGIFMTILALRGELSYKDRENFEQAVINCEVCPGLYNRNPGRNDLEAHDDYIGISTASFFLENRIAEEIVNYGKINGWSFDNTNPHTFSIRSWHDRFPGLVAHYRLCAGEDINFFHRFAISGQIRGNTTHTHGDESGKILTWLRVQVIKKNKFVPIAVDAWERSIIHTYGSFSKLFASYFGETHPFAKVEV